MNKLLLSLAALLSFSVIQGQSFWKDAPERAIQEVRSSRTMTIVPGAHRTVFLSYDALFNHLLQADDTENSIAVNLPFPNGSMVAFKLNYAPTVEIELQEKYPLIRSYRGFSMNGENEVCRITLTPLGLFGSILTDEGEIYIDPVFEGHRDLYFSYYVKDYDDSILNESIPSCGTISKPNESPLKGMELEDERRSQVRGGLPIDMKVFRVAIGATSAFTFNAGGTKESALSKIVASVDRGNQVFENEVGFRLVLVGNNDQVVFSGGAEPYNNTNVGRMLLGQNTVILNTYVGAGTYDIGHVFTGNCSDVGGVAALGSVCQGNRGNGVTCWYNSNINYTVVRIMCHEMGHQFSAPHTFNNCGGNESFGTGYEPGSGSTIMSYGGLCNSNNVVSGSSASRDITYYHANSLERIFRFSRFVSCGTFETSSNTRPQAIILHEDDFTIPIRTPFALFGDHMDMEDDPVTYCFEQHNSASISCPLGQPTGDCPLFRSFPPREQDYRVFPSFSTVWSNQTFSSRMEVLPDNTRNIDFVLTVRDNNEEVGAFGMDTLSFRSTENAGPFIVLTPSNNTPRNIGEFIEVTWDVANTDVAPVNCKKVNIKMYRSSDFTTGEMLVAETANDGSEWIQLPDEEIANVRIMVEAADNIFFDISNRGFPIESSTTPGYSVGLIPNSGVVCLPDVFTTEIRSSTWGGYQGNVELDIISGIPQGGQYSFTNASLELSQNTNLNLDFSNVTEEGEFELIIRAIGENQDTIYRSLNVRTVSNNFSALQTLSPADGSHGTTQSPSFSWPKIEDAEYYNVEVSKSPSFGATTIERFEFVTDTFVTLSELLEKSVLYYWRVEGVNECGSGGWTAPAAFSTAAASCFEFVSPDKNVRLDFNAVNTFSQTVNANAEIIDVNVPELAFTCNYLGNVVVSLESPKGTEITLFDKKCSNMVEFSSNFDDDAPTGVKCPPNQGKTYKPASPLSIFNGEDSGGKWKLKVALDASARQANLVTWSIQVCANQTLNPPLLITNDTLKTRTAENNDIGRQILYAMDANNAEDELEFTVLTVPTQGFLQLRGTNLTPGSTFTQADIDVAVVRYEHNGAEGFDDFLFTVNDGEGGWTGTHKFNIHIDDDFASSISHENKSQLFSVFPNPATQSFTLIFDNFLVEGYDIEVTDLQGRIIKKERTQNGISHHKIQASNWAEGIYLVKVETTDAFSLRKVIIQK